MTYKVSIFRQVPKDNVNIDSNAYATNSMICGNARPSAAQNCSVSRRLGAIPRKSATVGKTCDLPLHEGCYIRNNFNGRFVLLVRQAQRMSTASIQHITAAEINCADVVGCCPALQTSARTRITPSARASKKEFGHQDLFFYCLTLYCKPNTHLRLILTETIHLIYIQYATILYYYSRSR